MWWVINEEIVPHAKEMAGEKETVCCVRGYHIRIQGYIGSSTWGSAGV